MRTIYLDYAAATPLDRRVFAAMEPFLYEQFYNPSAAYLPARQVRTAYEEARHRLAMIIGARPAEIVMTAGATESINIAISGVMAVGSGRVVTTAIEHPAVLETAKRWPHRIIRPDSRGSIAASAVVEAVDDQTALVSVGYANNELGTIQPLREIAASLAELRRDRQARGISTPLYFHTDASQAAGYLDLSVARLGVDMMTLNAAKCYGPKQVGLLWHSPEVRLEPLLYGGGQERGIRPGTENVAHAVGFAAALSRADKHRKAESHRLAGLRDQLQQRLAEAIPGLQINGHAKKRLPNHLHISVTGLDGERALFALEQQGILVATGSACAANKGSRSHVLEAVGLTAAEADGSLRLTLGVPTVEDDINDAASAIIEVIARERGR